jgi:hypothetical protein
MALRAGGPHTAVPQGAARLLRPGPPGTIQPALTPGKEEGAADLASGGARARRWARGCAQRGEKAEGPGVFLARAPVPSNRRPAHIAPQWPYERSDARRAGAGRGLIAPPEKARLTLHHGTPAQASIGGPRTRDRPGGATQSHGRAAEAAPAPGSAARPRPRRLGVHCHAGPPVARLRRGRPSSAMRGAAGSFARGACSREAGPRPAKRRALTAGTSPHAAAALLRAGARPAAARAAGGLEPRRRARDGRYTHTSRSHLQPRRPSLRR